MSRTNKAVVLGFQNDQSHHGIVIVIVYGALVGGLFSCTSSQPEHTRDAFTRAEAAFFANDFRAADRAYSGTTQATWGLSTGMASSGTQEGSRGL